MFCIRGLALVVGRIALWVQSDVSFGRTCPLFAFDLKKGIKSFSCFNKLNLDFRIFQKVRQVTQEGNLIEKSFEP